MDEEKVNEGDLIVVGEDEYVFVASEARNYNECLNGVAKGEAEPDRNIFLYPSQTSSLGGTPFPFSQVRKILNMGRVARPRESLGTTIVGV